MVNFSKIFSGKHEKISKSEDPSTFTPYNIELEEIEEDLRDDPDYVRGETGHLKLFRDQDGNTYYERVSAAPQNEYIISKLLKGVINVSDVVEVNGSYFSKNMDLEAIEEKTSGPEQAADMILLYALFDDTDHKLGKRYSKNAAIKNGRATYFDFDVARIPTGNESNEHRNSLIEDLNNSEDPESILQKAISIRVDRGVAKKEAEIYSHLLNKIELLREQITPDFVLAILSSIDNEPSFETDEVFVDKSEMADTITAALQQRMQVLEQSLLR